MPKVNTTFYKCPQCKKSVRFKQNTYQVFVQNSEDPSKRGVVYQEEVEYKCTECGYIIAREVYPNG